MSRSLACVAVLSAVVAAVGTASASPLPQQAEPARVAPDAAKVREAAEAFDAGVSAFKNQQYELAASHFEAADAAVPSPQALRQAIRARSEARQSARAATLAAQALARYPGDEATVRLATEIVERLGPRLHRLTVRCASSCILAVGTRAIPGEARDRWVIYLDPGAAAVSASFLDRGGGAQSTVDAQPGGSGEVSFSPSAAPPPVEPAPAPVAPSRPLVPAAPRPAPAPQRSGGGLSPLVFVGGLVATAGLGGVTIWSGIDTINNPGADTVRAACAGRGTSCPEYQDGLARQSRTNVLIGATAGAGALTLVAALFTRWRGATPDTGARVAPIAFLSDRSAALGARGNF